MKDIWINKAVRGSVVATVVGVVGLLAYTIYGITFQYFDIAVFVAVTLGILFAVLDFGLKGQRPRFFNLLSVVSMSFAVGIFFMNSFPVWADNLTGITMYGSRGGLTPVIAVMVLMLIMIVSGIVACFTEKEGE